MKINLNTKQKVDITNYTKLKMLVTAKPLGHENNQVWGYPLGINKTPLSVFNGYETTTASTKIEPIEGDSLIVELDISDYNGEYYVCVQNAAYLVQIHEIWLEGDNSETGRTDKSGASIPNLNKIAQKTYVTWNLNEAGTEYEINDTQTTQPDNWYDYENGKWANIKTTNKISDTEILEAYWV